MTVDIQKIPVPTLMAHLPRDYRGFPVPFFQFIPTDFEKTGKVDFRVTNPHLRLQCLRENLCGICGGPLTKMIYFIGGPFSYESRMYTDPPMHGPCARYAVAVCPFLRNPNYRPTSAEATIEGTIRDVAVAVDRPPTMYLVRTDGFSPAMIKDGNTGKVHPMTYFYANPSLATETF